MSEQAGGPQRVQRRRAPGWQMPNGCVYVGRPSRWGNAFSVGSTGWVPGPTCATDGLWDKSEHPPLTREQAVMAFRRAEEWQVATDPEYANYLRVALGGKDLACWCPSDRPCHADVLLDLANRTVTPANT